MKELCKTKICVTCKREKPISEFTMVKKTRRLNVCKVCRGEYMYSYYNANKEKINTQRRLDHPKRKEAIARYSLKYRTLHRELVAARKARYYNANKELIAKKNKNYGRERGRGCIEAMDDYYVNGLLIHGTKLNRGDVPPELIELKRKQLTLKRLIKKGRRVTIGTCRKARVHEDAQGGM